MSDGRRSGAKKARQVVAAESWVSWLPDSKSAAITERQSVEAPYTVCRLPLETGDRLQLTFPPQGIEGSSDLHVVAAGEPWPESVRHVLVRRPISCVYNLTAVICQIIRRY